MSKKKVLKCTYDEMYFDFQEKICELFLVHVLLQNEWAQSEIVCIPPSAVYIGLKK